MKKANPNQKENHPVKESITIRHELPHFIVDREPELRLTNRGKEVYVTQGHSDNETDKRCPRCGRMMYKHGSRSSAYQDIELIGHLHYIVVRLRRYCCPGCGYSRMQSPGFTSESHRITKRLERRIIIRMNNGAGIVETARNLSVHHSIIKTLDKKRLSAMHMDRPKPARFIAIDEFLLHKGHRYATSVIDAEDGRVLFLEEGKRKQQAYDFFEKMGHDWMRHVKAVAMDMNAQYDSAFRERWPGIAIVYDRFHMMKLYNDTVLTKMRRRLQNELKEQNDEDGYNRMKGIRFILLSRRSTLQRKDNAARENNRRLYEDYRKHGKELPPGERMMFSGREKILDEILSVNSSLGTAYFLAEQFRYAFSLSSYDTLKTGMDDWCSIALHSEVPEVMSFRDTVISHMEGILNHARFAINSGKIEGVNNMIKTIRRKAYGYTDTEYFFLRIMFESRKPLLVYRSLKSYKFLN